MLPVKTIALVLPCLMMSHIGHTSPLMHDASIHVAALEINVSNQDDRIYTQLAQSSHTTCIQNVQKSTISCNKNAKTAKAKSSCTTKAQTGIANCTQKNNQASKKAAIKKTQETTLEMKKKALEIGND